MAAAIILGAASWLSFIVLAFEQWGPFGALWACFGPALAAALYVQSSGR